MKKIYPILSFVFCLNLGCASFASEASRNIANDPTSSSEPELSETGLLAAAKKNSLVAAYLKQDDASIDVGQLTFVKSPGTTMLCTLMASANNCSMSFRVLTSEGRTLMAGAIYYDGQTQKYSIFRILEGAPDSRSDFEAWSKL